MANEQKIETIKMSDGRLVDFVGKRKMLKDSFVTDDGAVSIRLDFRNGETRTYPLRQDLVLKFAAHGAEQKYGDETAGLEDVDDMVIAVVELHDRLTKGEWNVKREGGGLAGTSVLARAIAELKQKPLAEVKAFLAGKTQAEKMALRANQRLKPIIDRLESEKALRATKIDTDSMLDAA